MIAIYKSYRGDYDGGVAHTYDELWSATFAPVEWAIVILDKIKGGTYAEKKQRVYGLAVKYSCISDVPMYMSEYAEITAWFEKYGRRYGLLEEFRENGIC